MLRQSKKMAALPRGRFSARYWVGNMKKAPASRVLAVATAACAVVVFDACKMTQTTSKWRKGSTGQSQYERRMDKTVRETYNQMEALAAGDESADYTHSRYDKQTTVDTKSNLFRKKYAEGKDYRTKDFAGADEFKGQDYHFLKRQNYKAKTSPDQDQRFATNTAPDQKRKFFDRFKRAKTNDYAEGTRIAPTNDYRDTFL